MNAVGTATSREEEETSRGDRRRKLLELNCSDPSKCSKTLDSSLKRHTALIKRMRQSMGLDNKDQVMKDIDGLSLERYVEELVSASVEGLARCKTDRDVWGAVEIISAFCRRLGASYTDALINALSFSLAAPSRSVLSGLSQEQREKEESSRVSRQRPILRVCSELALVGVLRDGPGRSGAEWIIKHIKDLLSNDPSLTSLPLLATFLRTFARPYLGINTLSSAKSASTETHTINDIDNRLAIISHAEEASELIEKPVRERFRKMCDGYFDSVSRKLDTEHNRLQEQDRRNHEAYIRSGEIFEDRQQAYEKMTKNYEKLLNNCQTLSELLVVLMPKLTTAAQKAETILLSTSTGAMTEDVPITTIGGKWEDEEERRFYEDIPDLKDFVPRSILGVVELGAVKAGQDDQRTRDQQDKESQELSDELLVFPATQPSGTPAPEADDDQLGSKYENVEEDQGSGTISEGSTPTGLQSREETPPGSPNLAPAGPAQLLTALLSRLPDATNRTLIDQLAVDFAFLNSKAARKRLLKALHQVPKRRTDLLPYYSRLVAILSRYLPELVAELLDLLDEEFRYQLRKKKVVVELADIRIKNMTYLSCLTKFGVVPPHRILHVYKVLLDDLSGVNVDNLAILLEGCGRYLLRNDDTKDRFSTMVKMELMKRKQSVQHFDQRQLLVLENAYYQANPPERPPREEKHRKPIELFVRHLLHDVLAKRTVDKVLRLLRKVDWDDEMVARMLHNAFSKPWKIKYSDINLLAMLTYDLQRYHPAFSVGIVDQVFEDIRRGLEQNMYSANQQRVATIKYLGELYIYRVINHGLIFDILWSLVTFGHPDGRPLPGQACPIDMPDDFFRVRLVCVLLDTCGMCFDRGTQKKKLDQFLLFFQLYIACKAHVPMDVDFMITDSFEVLRPDMILLKGFEEAARAFDDLMDSMYADTTNSDMDISDDESTQGGERNRDLEEDDEDTTELQHFERPPSTEPLVTINSLERVGPSAEEEADFVKEFSRMVTDSSLESRKVDKKTALALWDASSLPGGMHRRGIDSDGALPPETADTMKFTVISKRGNRQQAHQLPVPSSSSLAVQTRQAQMQDKVEQQQLKQLVLNSHHRDEVEELRSLETNPRARTGIRIRYAG